MLGGYTPVREEVLETRQEIHTSWSVYITSAADVSLFLPCCSIISDSSLLPYCCHLSVPMALPDVLLTHPCALTTHPCGQTQKGHAFAQALGVTRNVTGYERCCVWTWKMAGPEALTLHVPRHLL